MVRVLGFIALAGIILLAPVGRASSVAEATTVTVAAPVLRTPLTPELPSVGALRVPAIVIDFPDSPSEMSTEAVQGVLFGTGDVDDARFASLRAFYRRSSYGKLDLAGDVLGVYRSLKPRAALTRGDALAQSELVADALRFFDAGGVDFSRYDADEDGRIDYLIVLWSGRARRGGPWWGSYNVGGSDMVVDGKRLGAYSWQPEPTDLSARTLVHETGHALGLQDLYDADSARGPFGGIGAFDPMGAGSCDLNALSKIMLGWIRPRVVSSGTVGITLRPTSVAPDAVIVAPGLSPSQPYREFFLVQARAHSGNDATLPYQRSAGLQVWHVDASIFTNGSYRCDNSSTGHRFLSLEEADGLRELEATGMGDESDLFATGSAFTSESPANSLLYSGRTSGVTLCAIRCTRDGVDLTVSALANQADRARAPRRHEVSGSRLVGMLFARCHATETPDQ